MREGKLLVTCSEQRKQEVVRYLKESISLYTELYPDGKYELSLGMLFTKQSRNEYLSFSSKACVFLCEAYFSLGKHDDALEMVKMAWDNSKNLPTGNPARMGSEFQSGSVKTFYHYFFFL